MAISELVGIYDADGGLLVPVRLLHLNELVGAAELDEMAGSVGAIEAALRRHLEAPAGGGAP